jgi:hypothetical protein
MATNKRSRRIGASQMNNEKNELIRPTPEQAYPGLPLPEDMEVLSPQEADALPLPFHGQCGDTAAEYESLKKPSREAGARGKSALSDSPKQP